MLCHTSKPVRSGKILCGSILFSLLPLTWRQEFKFCTFSVVTGATFKLEPYSPNLLSWYVFTIPYNINKKNKFVKQYFKHPTALMYTYSKSQSFTFLIWKTWFRRFCSIVNNFKSLKNLFFCTKIYIIIRDEWFFYSHHSV